MAEEGHIVPVDRGVAPLRIFQLQAASLLPSRMQAAGLSPEAMLENNDSYPALKAAGDLIVTGATGTNVNDITVILTEFE